MVAELNELFRNIYNFYPIMLVIWFVSATTTALLFHSWKTYELWWLCFIPGAGTAFKASIVCNTWIVAIPQYMLLAFMCYYRDPVSTTGYLMYICTVGYLFIQQMFDDYLPYLPTLGVYRLYVYWKEIISCQRCNRDHNTKKRTMGSKKRKNTKTKKPILK